MLKSLKHVFDRGDRDAGYFECRRCGTTVDWSTAVCRGCGARDIARYEL